MFQLSWHGIFCQKLPIAWTSCPRRVSWSISCEKYTAEIRNNEKICGKSEQGEKAEPKNKHKRVMEVCSILQEAELEGSLSQVAATMHVLTRKDRDGSSM